MVENVGGLAADEIVEGGIRPPVERQHEPIQGHHWLADGNRRLGLVRSRHPHYPTNK